MELNSQNFILFLLVVVCSLQGELVIDNLDIKHVCSVMCVENKIWFHKANVDCETWFLMCCYTSVLDNLSDVLDQVVVPLDPAEMRRIT